VDGITTNDTSTTSPATPHTATAKGEGCEAVDRHAQLGHVGGCPRLAAATAKWDVGGEAEP
jgi:hypothetical protein